MSPNGTDTSNLVVYNTTADNTNTLKTTENNPSSVETVGRSIDTVDTPPMTMNRHPVGPVPVPQQPQKCSRMWHALNMKREDDRLKTYNLRWSVPFMDPEKLSAAGFYYSGHDDVVRCAFCGVEIGQWEEGDDPFRDHQRWSGSCGFVRNLPVGNIPKNGQPGPSSSSSEHPSTSEDVCGPFMEIRPNAGPERGMSNGIQHSVTGMSNGFHHGLMSSPEEMQKHGINQSRGPSHPTYNTYETRLASYENWPKSLKQKPDKLSEAGFYYTGKGDQTVCFHCGGGLKDWEETDDPWVEHALWFPKCIHVILIKGNKFIEEVRQKKEESKVPIKVQETCGTVSVTPSTLTEPNLKTEEKVLDDARMCQICYQEERGVLFLPCGHLVACVKCAPSLSTCAVCRQPFTGTVRAFLS